LVDDEGRVDVNQPGSFAGRSVTVRFEAGYAVSALLGASLRVHDRLGVFAEAGLDWHYAVYGARHTDGQTLVASDSRTLEPIWLGQAIVNVGLSAWF
jgi:hypothetical protein